MTDVLMDIGGHPVLACAPDGPKVGSGDDALDLIGVALAEGAVWVAIPVGRISDEFFTLRTGLAGDIAQKFVNYQLGLAIVGDASAQVAASESFAALVAETNRGRQLWFVADEEELIERLGGRSAK